MVTGIVLEFQFGLNWSAYSVFVGNIFGAPLAIEGLLAFFLESTFIGLWIFGRERLSPRLHLATIWMVSVGTILSALFILAANAWMQHPVGYTVEDGQAVLTDFWAVLGNSTLWASFVHTVVAAIATGGALVLGISIWRAHRASDDVERDAFRRAAGFTCAVVLVAVILVAVSGDIQARLMDIQQPMKMAAAEALYNTQNGASFSLLTIGNLSGQPVFQIRVPHLLSLIADLSWNGQVLGINQMQAAEAAKLRSRRLRAGPLAHLLVLPGHGGRRRPDDPARPVGDLAGLAEAAGAEPVVRSRRARRHRAADHRQRLGLDLHRGGAPALDRLRPDADGEGRLHGQRRRRGWDHGRLRPRVLDPRGASRRCWWCERPAIPSTEVEETSGPEEAPARPRAGVLRSRGWPPSPD